MLPLVLVLLSLAAASSFTIHVPLYNPQLAPDSADTLGLLWAAQLPNAPPLSVAICAAWDFQSPSEACNVSANRAAAARLREAGVDVYHYVPVQQVPVQQGAAAAVCCNSLANISRFVSTALTQPNASLDGIFYDLATHDMVDRQQLPWFAQLYAIAQHGLGTDQYRRLMINPAEGYLLSDHLDLQPRLRVNTLETTLEVLRDPDAVWHQLLDRTLFHPGWPRSRFAAIVQEVPLTALNETLDRLDAMGYGAMFIEPDLQGFWKLPTYWEHFVHEVIRRNTLAQPSPEILAAPAADAVADFALWMQTRASRQNKQCPYGPLGVVLVSVLGGLVVGAGLAVGVTTMFSRHHSSSSPSIKYSSVQVL